MARRASCFPRAFLPEDALVGRVLLDLCQVRARLLCDLLEHWEHALQALVRQVDASTLLGGHCREVDIDHAARQGAQAAVGLRQQAQGSLQVAISIDWSVVRAFAR